MDVRDTAGVYRERMVRWRKYGFETPLVAFAVFDAGTVLVARLRHPTASAALTGLSLIVFCAWRRFPLLASLVSFAAMAGTLGLSPHSPAVQFFGMLVVFGLVGAVNRGRDLPTAVAAGLAMLLYATVVLPSGGGWPDFGLTAAISLSVLAGGWLVTHRTRQVAHMAAEVALAEERQLAHTRAALTAERARIARELHDVVSHGLSVVVVQSQAARGALLDLARSQPLPTGEVSRHLAAVESTARDALAEMRRMLGLLQLDAGDAASGPEPPSPGLEELHAVVDRARAAGVPVEAVLPDDAESLPAGLALTVHRIVQEALTNVVRHAPAAATSVTVVVGDSAVDVRVLNEPSTVPPSARTPRDGSGRGLIGMRERVSMYGGRLTAERTPDGGFEVHAVIPVSTHEVSEAAR